MVRLKGLDLAGRGTLKLLLLQMMLTLGNEGSKIYCTRYSQSSLIDTRSYSDRRLVPKLHEICLRFACFQVPMTGVIKILFFTTSIRNEYVATVIQYNPVLLFVSK